MQPNNSVFKKFVFSGEPPVIYQDPELLTSSGYQFPADSIFELHEIVGKSVKVVLPDGNTAYIDKETRCNFIKRSWANTRAEVYSQPEDTSPLITILNKGDEFMLYYALSENKWVKIQLATGYFGFIKAGTKCVTEDNLKNTVRNMINQNHTENAIVKAFAKQGVPEGYTRAFYSEISAATQSYLNTPEGIQAMAAKYRKRMIAGLLWTVGGLVVSVISYTVASAGGVYFVFWGAVIFGIIDFIRGLAGWIKYSRKARNS